MSPVARNVWQQVKDEAPASAALRLIMARTSRHVNGRPVCPSAAPATLLPVVEHADRIGKRCCFTVGTDPGWVEIGGGHVQPRAVGCSQDLVVASLAPERHRPVD